MKSKLLWNLSLTLGQPGTLLMEKWVAE